MTGAFTHGASVIHKFDVAISDEPTIIPVCPSAGVLHVGKQGPNSDRNLQIWFVVPVDGQGRPAFAGDGRAFEVHGTGHAVPGGRLHVGSTTEGVGVWHVFERRVAS